MTFRLPLLAVTSWLALNGPLAAPLAAPPAFADPMQEDSAPERSSPFEAIRWTDKGTPEVQFSGVWYEPRSIHGVAVGLPPDS
jgi:hypothetical protein